MSHHPAPTEPITWYCQACGTERADPPKSGPGLGMCTCGSTDWATVRPPRCPTGECE